MFINDHDTFLAHPHEHVARTNRWAPSRSYRDCRHRLSGLRPSIYDSFVPLLRVIRNWQKVKWACGHSFGLALCLLIPPSSLNNHVTRKLSRIPRSSTPSHALSISIAFKEVQGSSSVGPRNLGPIFLNEYFVSSPQYLNTRFLSPYSVVGRFCPQAMFSCNPSKSHQSSRPPLTYDALVKGVVENRPSPN